MSIYRNTIDHLHNSTIIKAERVNIRQNATSTMHEIPINTLGVHSKSDFVMASNDFAMENAKNEDYALMTMQSAIFCGRRFCAIAKYRVPVRRFGMNNVYIGSHFKPISLMNVNDALINHRIFLLCRRVLQTTG